MQVKLSVPRAFKNTLQQSARDTYSDIETIIDSYPAYKKREQSANLSAVTDVCQEDFHCKNDNCKRPAACRR